MKEFSPRKSNELARSLNLPHEGKIILIKTASSANAPKPHSVTYAKNEENAEKILRSGIEPIAIVGEKSVFKKFNIDAAKDISLIISNNPRLSFIKILAFLLDEKNTSVKETAIHPTALVEEGVQIGEKCRVMANVFIGRDTAIGNNVTLFPNVTIYGDTTIGNNVTIHSGTVIGKPGFGYEKNETGSWEHFPHIGGVIIENGVEIGSNSVIDRGALENTVIGEGSKIDNLVHVAHGVKIGKNCIVVACTQFGGSVAVDDDAWIGPNSSCIEGISLGKKCTVGVGAVLVKDVPDNTVVAGNPAIPIDDFKKQRKALKKLASGD